MNQKNYEALVAILEQCPPPLHVTTMAWWLASQGVLVPASLSDEQQNAIAWATDGLDEHANSSAEGTHLIPTLERIARGDQ